MTDRPIDTFDGRETRLAALVMAYTDQAVVPIDAGTVARTAVARRARRSIWSAWRVGARPSLRLVVVVGVTVTVLAAALLLSAGVRNPRAAMLISDHAGLSVLDPESGSSVRLAVGSGPAPRQLSWSPDRSRIAYVVRSGGVATLWVADAQGRDAHAVAPVSPYIDLPQGFSWSPDGTRLAVLADDGSTTGLAIVDADGGTNGPRMLARPSIPLGKDSPFPAWSPVGTSIAMTSSDGRTVIVDADKYAAGDVLGAARTLTAGGAYGPVWSPDGTRIAYTDDNTDLHIIGADGAGDRVLGSKLGYANIDWSPSGNTIAEVAIDGNSAASIIDVVTGASRPIEFPTAVSSVRWSPDGSAIGALDASGGLWMVRPDGSERERVAIGVYAFDW
jgi:Tol biopolymer transport system component